MNDANREQHVRSATTNDVVRIQRVMHAPSERVYKAFLDADALCRWLPPNGFTAKVHELDAKVGGAYRGSFTNFSTGRSRAFGGKYLELQPGARLRYTDAFDDPKHPGVSLVSVTLSRLAGGTELQLEQEGLPAAVTQDACYHGWDESLMLLTRLVEAEVPD